MSTSTPAVESPAVKSSKTPAPVTTLQSPSAEKNGAFYADRLHRYIVSKGGKYLCNEDGELLIHLSGRNIPLNAEKENLALAELFVRVCDITTVTFEAKIAIQRLQVTARQSLSEIRERHFASCSEGQNRIFIPIRGEKLVEISEDSIRTVPNVTNAENLWLKHPKRDPFEFEEADPATGLADFERLLVETLSCKHDDMRWFAAMHEGLFPFVRDFAKSRFLVTHEGGTQQGKTTGAQRFTLLHGLGDVTGDATVAALNNQKDTGLLVLDNKEQKNLDQRLIDYCLFLSTGASRIRSNSEGTETRTTNGSRPVGVITSIEGVHKAELAARNVPILFAVRGPKLGREAIEREISAKRHLILSAVVAVLQRFLRIRREQRATPNPFDGNFDAHFTALCNLLRAFAEVAKKPDEWAEGTISSWNNLISKSDVETEDSEYEYLIKDILHSVPAQPFFKSQDMQRESNVTIGGQTGTLFKMQCGFLLNELRKSPGMLSSLPRSVQGLSNRLATEKFQGFSFVRESDAPEHLKRTKSERFIGFFFPDDKVTRDDEPQTEVVTDLTHDDKRRSLVVVTR
jgi:hypothetical protein